MIEVCLKFSLCFAFLYMLEGIETAFSEKVNKVYKVTHIFYPAFMFVTILYVLINGFVR